MKNESNLARVVAQYRGQYRILTFGKELWAKVSGNFRQRATQPSEYPVVGDLVDVFGPDNDLVIINDLLPRHTLLQRKAVGKDLLQPIAANLDVAFIVQSVDSDFSLNRIERALVLIQAGKISPIIVLNKIDLIPAMELRRLTTAIQERFGAIKFITTSASSNDGVLELSNNLLSGKVYCFIGSSGVGKSSIINRILGKDVLATQDISIATGKGKHTTTHRELFVLKNGSMVIDNPGIREVGIFDDNGSIDKVFDDVMAIAQSCKYPDCTHRHEPGCAVMIAVKNGIITEDRYLNYLKLKKESAHYAMTNVDRKAKSRNLSRLIKNYYKTNK